MVTLNAHLKVSILVMMSDKHTVQPAPCLLIKTVKTATNSTNIRHTKGTNAAWTDVELILL